MLLSLRNHAFGFISKELPWRVPLPAFVHATKQDFFVLSYVAQQQVLKILHKMFYVVRYHHQDNP